MCLDQEKINLMLALQGDIMLDPGVNSSSISTSPEAAHQEVGGWQETVILLAPSM